MKRFLTYMGFVALLVACGARTRQSSVEVAQGPIEPKEYGFRVVESFPHATDSYTQGLIFVDGLVWEGTGQKGESRLLCYPLGSEHPRQVASLPRSEFGEGITLLNGELFFLTWMENTAHVFDPTTGREVRKLRYIGEGWGLTTDGQRLYLSDGSSTLRQLNPKDFSRERSIAVTLRGEPLEFLNELEWIDGKIWANVYTTDYIAIIDPQTGVVEGLVNLEGLLPEQERTPQTDVLNGIAYDAEQGRILVTGKNWSRMYEIELIEK